MKTGILLALAAAALMDVEVKPPPSVGDRLTMQSPTRIAVAPSGDLLVTDYKRGAVLVVDASDVERITGSFPTQGTPVAIGCDTDRILVGNESQRRIDIFRLDGKRLGTLGGEGFEVRRPSDLAIDTGRQLAFVVDAHDRDVKVFDLAVPDGLFLYSISGPGEEEDTFQRPTGIALDTNAEEVFVGDFGQTESGLDPRVLVFGYDGSYRTSISGTPGVAYYFSKPQGLAVDEAGHVFVIDAWFGRVVVMDRLTGSMVAEVGEYGTGVGQLSLPLDLVLVGPDKDLYVTNNNVGRIELFPEGGQF